MLPGRDGLNILRNLRERKITIPVILLTARSELNERLEETQRLKPLTRRLLLLAPAAAGQFKRALEPVNLSAELEGMIEDARVLGADARLRFDVQLPPQLRVEADRALLRTALFNLITNAIKFNEPAGRIAFRLEPAQKKILFTIGNTGPDIPPADPPKIFERFYRVNRVNNPRVDGVGAGLVWHARSCAPMVAN